jgi:pyridoxine 5-phosphate synthase
MTRLSVNINKVALLRNARGGNLPDLIQFARDCEAYGAEGITVHPRPDQRHIRYSDIPALREVVTTEFNIEGNPTPEFLNLVLAHPPHQCTLVPDAAHQLTSDHGWDTREHAAFLREVIARLHDRGIRVSLFVDPDPRMVEGAQAVGADRVELYTGPYAHHFPSDPAAAIAPYVAAAEMVHQCGLGLNAGHDLNLDNLPYFRQHCPHLLEVSIGHALISDALYFGIANAIRLYRKALLFGR